MGFETNPSSQAKVATQIRMSNTHSSAHIIDNSNSAVSVKIDNGTRQIGKHVFYDAYGAQPTPAEQEYTT